MIADIFPKVVSKLIPDVISMRDDSYVYLTFDDGPSRDVSSNLIEMLSQYDAKVSFFFSGQNVEHYPDLVELAANEGHTICSHGYLHNSLLFSSHRTIHTDLERANQVISDAVAQDYPIRYFRPPYGRFGLSALSAVRQLRMKIALWSYAPPDFRNLTPEQIARRTVKNVKPGDIVLLHERKPTLEAMEQMIEGLSERGLELRGL